MNQRLLWRWHIEQRVTFGGDVAEAITDDQKTIRGLHAFGERVATTQTEIADILIAIVVENVLRTEAGDDRDIVARDKRLERVDSGRCPAEIADDDQRAPSLLQQQFDLLHLRVQRTTLGDERGSSVHHVAHCAEHVFGNGQDDRSRSSLHGDVECATDIFRDQVDGVDLADPLRHIRERPRIVHFLKGFAPAMRSRHLAHDQHHRS